MNQEQATMMLKALDDVLTILIDIAPGNANDLDELKDALNKLDISLENTATGEISGTDS
jgi:hypothetical protein